jgi:endonuclease/exonuclease/phosphatase family metal-dependent hydrolase
MIVWQRDEDRNLECQRRPRARGADSGIARHRTARHSLPAGIGRRLDMVLASHAIADKTVSCVVQREFGTSDHGPVIATFDVSEDIG